MEDIMEVDIPWWWKSSIKINSQSNLPPGRWQVAEWVVKDAAFGQGEVGYRPSQLVFYFVYESKRNSRAACQGKTAQ